MDPISLATSAAALLASYLRHGGDQAVETLAGTLGARAAEKLLELSQWLRARIAGKPVAEHALRQLERQPDDPRRQVTLEVALSDLIESETAAGSDFAPTLERLVNGALQAGGAKLEGISDAGVVAGRDAYLTGRIVIGRDATFGGPPPVDGEGDQRP